MRTGSWLDGQEFPPLAYAVDGLLPEGFSLLIGPPKAGKSWLALSILLAVANGSAALAAIPMSQKRRVFYLALEDGDRRMQDRCRTVLGEAPIPDLFHYQTVIEPGFVVQTIEAFLYLHPDTTLIIVDTLGKVMPQAMPGESSYQRDYRVAGRLKRIADKHPGLSVVALHHDRKAASEDFVDSVSGTNGLAGAADTIVVLARKRQATEAVLMVTGRDVPEAEYAMTLDNGLWRLDGANLDEAAAEARQRQDSAGLGDVSVGILQFVRQHPDGCRSKDVVEKFGKDAYQYLGRLEERGDLTKVRRGFYRANAPIPGMDEEAA
ncbi:AAA family ATPase [Streptomyces sp. NPDC002680]|uniref:AAA family ATPase n=1 Tax=Streptomyces sp. NPDC002680 TaxID=3364659 RepID=UPI00367A7D95